MQKSDIDKYCFYKTDEILFINMIKIRVESVRL